VSLGELGLNLPVITVARKEFRDSITNRWFIILVAIFFLLILDIPYLVLVILGFFPYGNIPGKLGTFITSAIPFAALISLTVGSMSIVGEKDQGTLEYLLAQPVLRLEVLIGKLCGLLAAISIVMLVGFGLAAIPAFPTSEVAMLGLNSFVNGLAVIIGISAAMLGLSFAISVSSLSRAMALGLALFIWLFMAVIYNTSFLGLVLTLVGESSLFFYTILLNPIQVVQIMAFLMLRPEMTPDLPAQYMIRYFGYTGALLPLTISILVWVAVPIIFSMIEFSTKDL